jgi:hypothetical protein
MQLLKKIHGLSLFYVNIRQVLTRRTLLYYQEWHLLHNLVWYLVQSAATSCTHPLSDSPDLVTVPADPGMQDCPSHKSSRTLLLTRTRRISSVLPIHPALARFLLATLVSKPNVPLPPTPAITEGALCTMSFLGRCYFQFQHLLCGQGPYVDHASPCCLTVVLSAHERPLCLSQGRAKPQTKQRCHFSGQHSLIRHMPKGWV